MKRCALDHCASNLRQSLTPTKPSWPFPVEINDLRNHAIGFVQLPKLDVAGTSPVARSSVWNHLRNASRVAGCDDCARVTSSAIVGPERADAHKAFLEVPEPAVKALAAGHLHDEHGKDVSLEPSATSSFRSYRCSPSVRSSRLSSNPHAQVTEPQENAGHPLVVPARIYVRTAGL